MIQSNICVDSKCLTVDHNSFNL